MGASKMVVLDGLSIQEIHKQFPKTLLIMSIVYLITSDQIQRFYATNKYCRTLFSMEFRFIKSIDYVRFISLMFKSKPDSIIFNFIVVDIIEATLILFTSSIQHLIISGKWSLDDTVINRKFGSLTKKHIHRNLVD